LQNFEFLSLKQCQSERKQVGRDVARAPAHQSACARRTPPRRPSPSRLPEAARAPRPLKSAHATWSPRPRRQPCTALPAGPSPTPLRERAAQVSSPYCGVMAGTIHNEGLKALPSPTAYLRGLHPCSRVAPRRHTAMAAAGPSCRAPPFSGRATIPVSCLGPIEAQKLTCCPAFQGTCDAPGF
jgi:hypothetical protein